MTDVDTTLGILRIGDLKAFRERNLIIQTIPFNNSIDIDFHGARIGLLSCTLS